MDEIERAAQSLDAASARLRSAAGRSGSGKAAPKRADEAVYADAYRRLARLGQRPQLRARYR